MAAPTIVTSKITARNQTTLPSSVRTVLGVDGGSRLGYVIEGTTVRIVNASALEGDDPVLDRFLGFVARSIEEDPQIVTMFPMELVARIHEVTAGVEIDHGARIEGVTAL